MRLSKTNSKKESINKVRKHKISGGAMKWRALPHPLTWGRSRPTELGFHLCVCNHHVQNKSHTNPQWSLILVSFAGPNVCGRLPAAFFPPGSGLWSEQERWKQLPAGFLGAAGPTAADLWLAAARGDSSDAGPSNPIRENESIICRIIASWPR